MKVEDLIIDGKKYLSSYEAKMLLSQILDCDYLEILTKLDMVVSDDLVNKYKKLIELRKQNVPIQYIINSTKFYYLDLYVNENVLIPRFETEELVDNTIDLLNKYFKNPKVLDLCCGSGAIGLAIKNTIKNSTVDLSDISSKALDVANFNKDKLGLDVKIVESDLFSNIKGKYDCIISNPPYIKTNEDIEVSVKNYEPHLALYGGDDGLFFYEKILSNIKEHLNDEFLIAFEIGNTQNNDIINLINKYLDNVKIISKKDMQDKDRMIFILNVNKE